MPENIYYCPVNAWDCPYWRKDGTCEFGIFAPNECDDAAAMDECLEDDSEDIWIFGVDGPIIYHDPMS